jgi:DNA-binding NarL/FixJ family response regulator
MPTNPKRVLLVDDHQLLVDAVAAALNKEGIEADKADLESREAVIAQVWADPPDLVLLDLDLGGTIGDGSTLVRPLTSAGAQVLIVTASSDRTRIGSVLELGAIGYVAKSAPFHQLLRTVTAAAAGAEVMSVEERHAFLTELRLARQRRAAADAPFERLTPREQEVLRSLATGHSVGQIATESVVSESTVRSQVRAILTKLGVGSQLEAVTLALRSGWLTPGKDLHLTSTGTRPFIPEQR